MRIFPPQFEFSRGLFIASLPSCALSQHHKSQKEGNNCEIFKSGLSLVKNSQGSLRHQGEKGQGNAGVGITDGGDVLLDNTRHSVGGVEHVGGLPEETVVQLQLLGRPLRQLQLPSCLTCPYSALRSSFLPLRPPLLSLLVLTSPDTSYACNFSATSTRGGLRPGQ